MTEYEIHPAAELFPMMTPEAREALKEDIREHGQREWAVLLDGKLLDGRNRYRACQELSIELECCELEAGTDPIAYVLSKNLHRRHLTREQRDEVINKLRSMGRTCQQIADAVGVNKATVSRVVANATTESPGTITGKDGKQYPAKKAGRRERRADPAGYEQFKKDAAAAEKQRAAKQAPANPAGYEEGEISIGRTLEMFETSSTSRPQPARNWEPRTIPVGPVIGIIEDPRQAGVPFASLDDFLRRWNATDGALKELIQQYLATESAVFE